MEKKPEMNKSEDDIFGLLKLKDVIIDKIKKEIVINFNELD